MCLHGNNGVGSDTLISSHAVWQFVLMRTKAGSRLFLTCFADETVILTDSKWMRSVSCRWASLLPVEPVRGTRRVQNSCGIHLWCFSQRVLKLYEQLWKIAQVNRVKRGVRRFSRRVAPVWILVCCSRFALFPSSWSSSSTQLSLICFCPSSVPHLGCTCSVHLIILLGLRPTKDATYVPFNLILSPSACFNPQQIFQAGQGRWKI